MTSEEKMREEFEAWDRAAFGSGAEEQVTDEHGEYEDSIIRQCWMAWKASRESLVIELPQPFVGDDFIMYDGEEIIGSIHAAGVKTK